MKKKLTRKERCILGFLDADDGGETAANIGEILAPNNQQHGRREWAHQAIRELDRLGYVVAFGIAI
ncbi:MAG: hypothetical protein JNL61_08440, partial [Rhizobiaceae bacterium]|nr:hypothetical protein [Rhizobiaceae bacterium]